MIGCNPIDTPIEQNDRLSEVRDNEFFDKGIYQKLVGKLIYLSHTHLDIAYTLSVISQSMHGPKNIHLQAVYRVIPYLIATPRR